MSSGRHPYHGYACRAEQYFVLLQEVQSTHFADFLMPELEKHGYTAVYKKKTAELFTSNRYAIDGCATFYRRDRFALVKKYEVNTGKLEDPTMASMLGKC